SGTLELAFSNNPQVLIDPQYYNYGVLQTLTLTGATIGSTQITLSAGNAFAAPITYTGVAATDQANIAAALTSLSTIGGVGGTATVTQVSPGVFNVLFGGGLAGLGLPVLDASITAGTGNASVASSFGTVPVGFKVPNELLTLNGWGVIGIYSDPAGRNTATRNTGPVPAADGIGTLQSQKGENS